MAISAAELADRLDALKRIKSDGGLEWNYIDDAARLLRSLSSSSAEDAAGVADEIDGIARFLANSPMRVMESSIASIHRAASRLRSSSAAVAGAVRVEREAIAQLCDADPSYVGSALATRIRARGQKKGEG